MNCYLKYVVVAITIAIIPANVKAEAIHLNESNFSTTVKKSKVPVLVDFWAPWCGPCLKLAPTIDELAKLSDGKAIVSKINIDEHPEIAQAYGIQAIPTIIIFKEGEVQTQLQGIQPLEKLLQELVKEEDPAEEAQFPSILDRLTAIELKEED